MNKVVALDDGHGIDTFGKRTPQFSDGTYMKENEFNEKVMFYTQENLVRCGIGVMHVAPEQTDTSLSLRVQRANNARADIYISIHANAYGSSWNTANGFETYIYSADDYNTLYLAECVHGACISATGLKNRGIKENPTLFVLNSTKMPAILVECGFMTNKDEAELLMSDDYRKTVAEAIAKGVCRYYGVVYREKEEEKEVEVRYNNIEEVPSWARSAVQKLIDKGKFADVNKLDLSYDMVRMIVVMS